MSFYRKLIAAVAAMGLATAVFAADENTQSSADETAAPQAVTTTAEATTTTTATESTTTTQEKVNVNTASAKDLMKVKGLNSAKAKAIVSYRKKHGEFKSLDELKQVKGFKKMNEKSMQDLQDQLTVG